MLFENSLIAIDIGSYSIKVAEFSGGKNKSVSRLGLKTLPAGAVVGGLIREHEMVKVAINQILKEMGVRRLMRRACLSISGSNLIVRRMPIIRNESVELNEQVFFEAEKQLQMDMNELYFDYVYEKATVESLEKVALLAASKREIVDERVSILAKLGIGIGVIDAECYALANIVEYTHGQIPGLIAILNIGGVFTNIIFIFNGNYLYSREIGVAGEQYTRSIGEVAGVSTEVAESMKVKISSGETALDEHMVHAIMSTHEAFINEVQQTVDAFMQSVDAPPGKEQLKGIFLTGGGAAIPGLAEAIRNKIQIPAEIFDPFSNMKVPKKFPGVKYLSDRLAFGVCAGLGLRNFNEIREE